MILSTQSFTLFETIIINVVFWGLIICAIIFLVLSFKIIKDEDIGECNPYDRT